MELKLSIVGLDERLTGIEIYLQEILDALGELQRQGVKIMATLDQALAAVQSQTTVVASVSALLTALKEQIDEYLTGANLPPVVQAKVDEIFATAQANKDALAAAVVANTQVG